MPELPEVQTIISDLNQKIKGDVIVGFWSDWGKAIKSGSVGDFSRNIKGRKILEARRIGKNIFLDLSGGKTLYIHLKMTGHLLVKKQDTRYKKQKNSKFQNTNQKNKDYFSDRVNQYIHHIFYLSDSNSRIKCESTNKNKKYDKTLEFSDLRKFGKIVLDDTEKINNLKEIKSLGIDAMSVKFTFKKFQEILDKKSSASRRTKIGIILMDQNLIAGIGNIYRSEILFDAGILPERTVEKINNTERKKLYNSIKKILKKAIKYRGTSDSDYRDTSGAPGNYQKIILVYRCDKQKCRRCGIIIKQIKLGQRSMFFCPKCQK